jgi:hypothetical protein
VRVIPICPNRTTPTKRSIDGAGNANRETLEAPHERRVSIGLDDEMKMICLHTELNEAKPVAGSFAECAADGAKHVRVAQRRHARPHPHRDVDGAARDVRRSLQVRNASATPRRFASGATTASAPGTEGESELARLLHDLNWR